MKNCMHGLARTLTHPYIIMYTLFAYRCLISRKYVVHQIPLLNVRPIEDTTYSITSIPHTFIVYVHAHTQYTYVQDS